MTALIPLADLTEISLAGIVLLIFNVLLSIAVTIIGFSVRRLVGQNDRGHDDLAKKIDQLAEAVSGEREARHALFRELSANQRQTDLNIAENYPQRRETMRQFGTMIQRLESAEKTLGEKIDRLPCVGPRPVAPQCPREAEHA